MDYPFECEDGHVVLESHRMSEAPPIGAVSVCPCGKPSRRIVALPCRPLIAREDHRDFDSDDWEVHREAQRDIEVKTALGIAAGEKGRGPRAARVRPEKVREYQERFAKGEKPPESATLGHILPHEKHLYVSPDKAIEDAVAAEKALGAA